VPLPAPGAPNSISLMDLLVFLGNRSAGADSRFLYQNSMHPL
jgi:hypothetical protein